MDYNTTDLLHEPKQCLTNIIEFFSTSENLAAVEVLQSDSDILYNAVQHHYPLLIATSVAPQQDIKFALGDSMTFESNCSLSETIVRFFKERLATALDSNINLYYNDIIKHSLHKILL